MIARQRRDAGQGAVSVLEAKIVCGVPIGTPSFAQGAIATKVTEMCSYTKTINDKLCSVDPQPLLAGAAGPGILSDTLASRRLRLPLSFGGGGLRSVFATVPAAFCGRLFAVASKLSAIAPKPTAAAFDGGETGDGFLAAPARWRSLLAGPSRLASELKSAWLKLTSESAHARLAASNAGEEPPNPGLLDAPVERAGLKVTVDEGQSAVVPRGRSAGGAQQGAREGRRARAAD
ncbi:hypothetical protein JL720_17288 [Aureococcus anophagefferens]|nr:hypothetical protein JL720_17288 [Aureococcus anophagefferens]